VSRRPFGRSRPSEGFAPDPLVLRESFGESFPLLTDRGAGTADDPVEVIWCLGAPELVERICWRVCRVCEVYWIGQPGCWLCGMPCGSGFPRLEAVAAQNPIGEDGDLFD
jgi:hypothetical protein